MKMLTSITLFVLTAFTFSLNAQTVSDFENLTLPADSFWNGSDDPLGTTFTSGNAIFPCFYDTSFGGFWDGGWAYSNQGDSVTPGTVSQHSSRAGSGFNGSSNFAIGKRNAVIKLTGNAAGKAVEGFYVTNTTYAYYSMKDGDMFAKQFGSPTNASGTPDGTNGEDWFRLTIKKYYNGVLSNDSVNFYLADYRFEADSQDYIVKTWQWVDLTSLGNVDSLLFILNSSDVGQFGMNTPGFYCVDNFTTRDIGVFIDEERAKNVEVTLYPNPVSDYVTLQINDLREIEKIQVFDVTGTIVYSEVVVEPHHRIDISEFESGLYKVVITGKDFVTSKGFVKQ